VGDAALQLEAPGQRARLQRRPGADPAGARPAGEIHVRLFRSDLLDRAFDADLPVHRLPVEAQRRPRHVQQLLALATLVVGVEGKAARVEAAQQHHADRRLAVGADGGERHGLGVGRLARRRLLEPGVEQVEGIVRISFRHGRRSVRAGRMTARSGDTPGRGSCSGWPWAI
jgi:hypothetical protein